MFRMVFRMTGYFGQHIRSDVCIKAAPVFMEKPAFMTEALGAERRLKWQLSRTATKHENTGVTVRSGIC